MLATCTPSTCATLPLQAPLRSCQLSTTVGLAVFQETVHHTAFPEVYKGEYRRDMLVNQASSSSQLHPADTRL